MPAIVEFLVSERGAVPAKAQVDRNRDAALSTHNCGDIRDRKFYEYRRVQAETEA
jgi:hypothetical protein